MRIFISRLSVLNSISPVDLGLFCGLTIRADAGEETLLIHMNCLKLHQKIEIYVPVLISMEQLNS
jgi:hypothetical protein